MTVPQTADPATDRYAHVRAGDPNPRSVSIHDAGDCPARSREGRYCTLDVDHGPHHVAEGPTHVLAVWVDGRDHRV